MKGVIVYLTNMNPTCKGIVVNYGSHLFMMCMKTTKCPPVAALPLHVFFLSLINDLLSSLVVLIAFVF